LKLPGTSPTPMIVQVRLMRVLLRPNAAAERPAKPVRSSGLFGSSCDSQVFRPQARALGDPGQHAGADLLVLMESEHEIGPAGPR
jgi:hypothetical protein